MVMSLPERVLALGAHLDDAYPDELREPSDAELTELIARFEPVPPDADDCGARDWSVLEQRMHYIVHLFCAFHLREELSRPPFTPEQVERFGRGRRARRRAVTRGILQRDAEAPAGTLARRSEVRRCGSSVTTSAASVSSIAPTAEAS